MQILLFSFYFQSVLPLIQDTVAATAPKNTIWTWGKEYFAWEADRAKYDFAAASSYQVRLNEAIY